MQRINNVLILFRYLGAFSLILLLSFLGIVVTSYNIFQLNAALLRISVTAEKRFLLDETEFLILEKRLLSREFLITDGEPEATGAYQEVDEELDALAAELDFYYDIFPEDQEAVEALFAGVDGQTQGFEELVAAFNAGDFERVDDLYEETAGDINLELQARQLVNRADIELRDAERGANEIAQDAVIIATVGLLIFPFLAVLMIFLAGRITQPILTLINAVTAVEGGQYQRDHLFEVMGRSDGFGQLAATIDQMARSLDEQESELEEEIQRLQGELRTTRRRRLMTHASGKQLVRDKEEVSISSPPHRHQ